jgi:DNA-binding winged helix-turn-helix (wHTH) protein/TolB-like protein/Flp pilus assembly protein TadD
MGEGPSYTFGKFRVLAGRRELLSGGAVVPLGTRAFDILLALVEHHGALVTKERLMAEVWPDALVEENTLAVHVSALRRSIGDGIDGARFVQTVPGRGYRFIAPVERHDTETEAPGNDDLPAVGGAPNSVLLAKPRGSPGRLYRLAAAAVILTATGAFLWSRHLVPRQMAAPGGTILVIPFQNLTGDPTLDTMADALTEDVISRGADAFEYYDVLPRDASLALKGKPVDERALVKKMGVRYVLEGSLRKGEHGYRLQLMVVDGDGGQPFSPRDISRPTDDPRQAEGELADNATGAVADSLMQVWGDQELAKAPDDSDPWNIYVRAYPRPDPTRETVGNARQMFERALALAPNNWQILNDKAYFDAEVVARQLYSSDQERADWLETALSQIDHALAIRPGATGPHMTRAFILELLRRWDEAKAECKHVMINDPLASGPYRQLGQIEFLQGHFAEALANFQEALARNADGSTRAFVGLMHLNLNQYDQAIAELRETALELPDFPWPPFILAAALEMTGHHEEALANAQLYRKLDPQDDMWRVLNLGSGPAFAEQAERVRAALHRVGLDEPDRGASKRIPLSTPQTSDQH